jgi:glycolate oxidase
MPLTQVTLKSEAQLIEHIQTNTPTLYTSSRTSTVIPYEKIDQYLGTETEDITLADLSLIPGKMFLTSDNNLVLRGAVSWKEARDFLKSNKLNIMTSPTEELALVLAGVATSCTGERCFSFGNLRSQIVSIKYLNYEGHEVSLKSCDDLQTSAAY